MNESTSDEPNTDCGKPLDQLKASWARGDCISVESFLARKSNPSLDDEQFLDLIYGEVFLREQRGDTISRSEYLSRFPHIADELAPLFDVHEVLGAIAVEDVAVPIVPGFQLLTTIGQGGMGTVWRARDVVRKTDVAVKLLRADLFRKQSARKRWRAEAQALALLDHPHLVKVYEVGECEAGPFIAMELLAGDTMECLVRRGPQPPNLVVAWLTALAEAVHYAHGRGVIHRDLTPANIMFDVAGRPRVLDFGMAKILRSAEVAGPSSTEQGTILGTPAYMPPEQAGEVAVTPTSANDVYSLGAILYALLTGRPPFDEGAFLATVLKVRSSELPRAVRLLRPEVPEELERIVMRCLQKQPADRYPSALVLAEDLRRLSDRNSVRADIAGDHLVSLATGEAFDLSKPATLIGRSAECDIKLTDRAVSRRHCRIVRVGAALFAEDLGSSRGTRVNGVAAARVQLTDGDRLEIAAEAFQVRLRR